MSALKVVAANGSTGRPLVSASLKIDGKDGPSTPSIDDNKLEGKTTKNGQTLLCFKCQESKETYGDAVSQKSDFSQSTAAA